MIGLKVILSSNCNKCYFNGLEPATMLKAFSGNLKFAQTAFIIANKMLQKPLIYLPIKEHLS
jgi:hypothetical protein